MYSIKPSNYEEIKSLFISDIKHIYNVIIREQPIIFYDTCSLSNHARFNEKSGQYDALDFFSESDSVIITDKILFEMINKSTGTISAQYIDYLNRLKNKIKNLVLLCECEIESLLSFKFDDKDFVRNIILNVLKGAFIQLALPTQKKLLHTIDLKCKDFLKTLLMVVDIAKKNRGEISIVICMLSLDRLMRKNFKIITDDKNSINYLIQPFKDGNIKSNVAIFSTPKITQFLFIHKQKWTEMHLDDFKTVLDTIRPDQNNKILFKHIIDEIAYENVVEENMVNTDLCNRITNHAIEILF